MRGLTGSRAEETLNPETIQAILQKAAEVQSDPTRFAEYADFPIEFARDILGIKRLPHQPPEFFPNDCGLWTKQQDILTAARDHGRVVCKSGHVTGKSFSLAVLVAWWFLARQGRVLSTGPTRKHIQDVLWPELHELHRKSLVSLPGQLDKLHWSQDAYWYATGFTTDEPGAFQGRHHPRLAILIDEAANVADTAHLEAETCAGAEGNLIVLVGNPTLTSGRFYNAFTKLRAIWHPITISCLEHPNVVSGETLIPGAISQKQVERWKADWGETHPFWYSRVLGEFPLISEKAVIPLLWVNRSQNEAKRQAALRQASERREQRVAGLDVARYGDNKCVWMLRSGDAIEKIVAWSHASTSETAGRAIRLCRDYHVPTLVVDASGIGGGVVDRLHEQTLPFTVLAHNGGHRAGRAGMFSNRRTEGWWHLRHRFEKRRLWLPEVADVPDVDTLVSDLLAPTYDITAAGRIQVETKEKLMERGVKSPDYADALVMCFLAESDPEAELEEPVLANQDPEAHRALTWSPEADESGPGGLPYGY